MKCPNCGETIDVNDKECFYCGSKIDVHKKERRWTIFVAIFFAIIVIYSCYDLYKNITFKNYPETTAYLISYTMNKSNDDIEYNCKYLYVVDYNEYEAKETTSTKPIDGSTKQIKYDLNNPDDYVFDPEGKIKFDIIEIVVFSIAAIVFFNMKNDLVHFKTEEQQIIEAKEAEEQEVEPCKQAYFRQFDTYIDSLIMEEDKISKEYEQKCIDYLEHLSDEEFNTFCKLMMERYRKLEKMWEGQIPPEDYENGTMIKDSANVSDSEVLKHITPVCICPDSSDDGICFHVDFEVTWDPEHGSSWTYNNGEMEVR